MFGNGFYNPYMYQPYHQTANIARNLGGFAGANASNIAGNGMSRALGGFTGNAVGSSTGSGLANGLGGLLSKFSFSGFLNGASKTLNVVNQAIPIFYQVRPIINNAKTMFKIMGAVKDDDSSKNNVVTETRNNNTSTSTISNRTNQRETTNSITPVNESIENPVFFI